MEIAYIFRALLRRKWIIIISTVVALVAAFFFTKNNKKKYHSFAQLSTGFTVSEEIKLSDDRFNLPQIDVKFSNAIENITSTKVLSLLSYRLLLHDLKDPKPFTVLSEKDKEKEKELKADKTVMVKLLQDKLDSIQMLSPTVENERKLQGLIDLYKYSTGTITSNLKVARYQRTDYINIDYTSENADMSAYAVNTLCSEFKRFYGYDQGVRTGGSVLALDSMVKAKKAVLDQKIADKNTYASSEGVVDVTLQGSSNLGQVSTYESQLIEEKANESNLSFQVNELQSLIQNARAKGVSVVASPDAKQPASTSSNYELLQLKKQYNDLNDEYLRKNGNDSELKAKIDQLNRKIQTLTLNSASRSAGTPAAEGVISVDELVQRKIGMEGQLKATRQKIGAIQSRISQLNGGLRGIASKGANMQQLDKEIEMAQADYREATDKYNLALNINSPMPGIFKQTISGEPALRPEPSKRMMMMAVAAVVAFVISCIVVIAIEFFDQSVKTPTQFQRLTGLHLLGTVNWIKLQNNILDRVTVSDGKENRDNIFRELLRKLRYELENSRKKIYLFTSTEPGQGKTTLIQSLAYSLSLSKKKVLIIDTNFCNNDLTVATQATPMLEKFSLNGKPFEVKDVNTFITKTAASGVDIIGCEGGDYTPSEILPKNHLLNYLDQLREEYDYIFMEGAPLNGYTDSKELVGYADGLVAIFSAEAVFSAADRESITFLNENKDKFIGAILNKVQESNLNL
ncbi:MAG: hypothetical protein EOO00_02785 [Chitinophagaceae bacterium]|nr:MAG: hypothetical protein EOO00_02785 [Chitinophagaceae bacterium]